jgi:hypothetical protein
MCKVITSLLNFVGIKSMSITNLNISYKRRILTVTFSNGFSSEFHPDILFEDKFKTSNFLKQRNALEGMD